jgi:hypothetical protein
VPTKSSCRPKSVSRARGPDRVDQPVHVARERLGGHVDAGCTRGACRLRPDRDGGRRLAERAVRRGRGGGGEDDEVARRPGVRPERQGAVERDDVGAERLREEPSRALRAGEEHAAGVGWERRQQAFLRRRRGDDVDLAEGVGRRASDRGHPPRRPGHASPQLAGADRARQHDPVVPVDGHRFVAERLDRDERDVVDGVALAPEALDELPLAPGGPRHDDRRGAGARSHP